MSDSPKNMTITAAREAVCQSGKRLLAEGLVARTWGNVSIRLDETHMIITPSGRKYDELQAEEMVLVDFTDYRYEGRLKPSSELKLHGEIYKTRPEIQAVIHTHQMHASIVAAAQSDVEVLDPAHQKILGSSIIKAAPYALPNTRKITKSTAHALGANFAALMSNHGVVCCGSDLDDVFHKCQTLENACALYIESRKNKAIS